MTLGQKIRKLREDNCMTQRELASVLCIGEGYLSKIENDQKPLKRSYLTELSKFFKTPLKELEALWLGNKIYSLLKNEKTALTALKSVKEQLTNSNEN